MSRQCRPNVLGSLLVGLVDVPQFVGFVDHNHVKRNRPQFRVPSAGVVVRHDDDSVGRELFAFRLRVHHDVGQIEFVLNLQAPLLSQPGGTDHQQPPLLLSPLLAEHQPCFDGFPQSHFILQDDALRRVQVRAKELGLTFGNLRKPSPPRGPFVNSRAER